MLRDAGRVEPDAAGLAVPCQFSLPLKFNHSSSLLIQIEPAMPHGVLLLFSPYI